MIESLRAKYVQLSIKVYFWVTAVWHAHITKQHTMYMNNIPPEIKRQIEWKLKLEE